MRILAGHQASFLPWMGFWEKVIVADVFVWMNDVVYKNKNWINRVEILNPGGRTWWTIPVHHGEHGVTKIKDVKVQLDAIPKMLKKMKGWMDADLIEELEAEFTSPPDTLDLLNWRLFKYSGSKLKKFPTAVYWDGTFDFESHQTQRVIDYCRMFDCDALFSGKGASDFLDMKMMDAAGIQVIWQNWIPMQYPQKYTDKFEDGLSIIDAIHNKVDLDPFVDRCLKLKAKLKSSGEYYDG